MIKLILEALLAMVLGIALSITFNPSSYTFRQVTAPAEVAREFVEARQ